MHEASTMTKCIDIVLLILAVIAWVKVRRIVFKPTKAC